MCRGWRWHYCARRRGFLVCGLLVHDDAGDSHLMRIAGPRRARRRRGRRDATIAAVPGARSLWCVGVHLGRAAGRAAALQQSGGTSGKVVVCRAQVADK